MLPLSAKLPFNWRDLTPVSVIAMDQFVLWDNTTLPYKNVKEFIAAAKTADPPFKMGGTGSKREDQVVTAFVEKKTGARFAYLPYKSGGEAATQLVGNHKASNVNNPSENLEVWRAGQVRALCVFDKERIAYKSKVTDTMSCGQLFRDRRVAWTARLRASAHRPLSGVCHERWLHRHRRREPGELGAHRRRARPSGMAQRSAVRDEYRAYGQPAGARRRDERGARLQAPRRVARATRRGRCPRGARPLGGRSPLASADAGPRHGCCSFIRPQCSTV